MNEAFYLGQIIQFSGDFEIEGFTSCDGRELKISNYQALYSILGTRFGGDGKTTFQLPKIESSNGVRYLIRTNDAVYPVR